MSALGLVRKAHDPLSDGTVFAHLSLFLLGGSPLSGIQPVVYTEIEVLRWPAQL